MYGSGDGIPSEYESSALNHSTDIWADRSTGCALVFRAIHHRIASDTKVSEIDLCGEDRQLGQVIQQLGQ
jgi:hypothetical protein